MTHMLHACQTNFERWEDFARQSFVWSLTISAITGFLFMGIKLNAHSGVLTVAP